MSKNIIIDNGIIYQLVGNVYYPTFADGELPLGTYGKIRKDYLENNNLVQLDINYTKHYFRYELFCLNSYCEQYYQNLLKEHIKDNPNQTRKELEIKKEDLKKHIIDNFLLQPKEVIFDGEKLKISE